jgi:hypothetical protein
MSVGDRFGSGGHAPFRTVWNDDCPLRLRRAGRTPLAEDAWARSVHSSMTEPASPHGAPCDVLHRPRRNGMSSSAERLRRKRTPTASRGRPSGARSPTCLDTKASPSPKGEVQSSPASSGRRTERLPAPSRLPAVRRRPHRLGCGPLRPDSDCGRLNSATKASQPEIGPHDHHGRGPEAIARNSAAVAEATRVQVAGIALVIELEKQVARLRGENARLRSKRTP